LLLKPLNRKNYWLIFLVVFVCLAASTVVFSQTQPQSPLPQSGNMVSDYADVMDSASEAQLERRLRNLRTKTTPSIEMAVVTVKTTGGQDIFDYSLAVARGWGIGAKTDDNPSLLLLVAIDDRKYFTQTSRDIEGDLPDGFVGQVQREKLVPAFRQGLYAQGITDTIDAYVVRVAQQRGIDLAAIEAQPSQTRTRPTPYQPRKSEPVQVSLGTCCLIIVVIFIIFLILSVVGARGLINMMLWGAMTSGGGWSGGSFGGSGGRDDSGWSNWGGGDDGGFSGFGGGGDFGGGGAGGEW
jgi:uncharacterized protein